MSVAHLLERPRGARWLYVLAHGAGAGMRHPFMAGVAQALAARGIATLRWELSYMTAGRRRPDGPDKAVSDVRDALALARTLAPRLRVIAGGKSYGGRMTSTALAERHHPEVEGLAFLGFPLHPKTNPGTERSEHLAAVKVPMLFVQGERDELAEMRRMRRVVAGLPRATMSVIAGADHGFAVAKRSGRDAIGEVAEAVAAWIEIL